MNKFTFLPAILLTFMSVFFWATFTPGKAAAEDTGSISVCKIAVDQNNNIVTGSDRPGETFTISGFTPIPVASQGSPAGLLPTITFSTPLALNSHILANTSGNDSQCITYDNLAFGNYYWGRESNPSNGWDTPYYSDQYTGPANSVANLYSYDNNLFDGNTSNDDTRNLNADGHIVLTSDRPTRVLIILNRYASENNTAPNPTPTTDTTAGSGSSTSTSGGSSFTTTCNDIAPSSAPVLNSVIIGQNSVTLSWTAAGNPVSYYYVNYGVVPGKYIYGNTNAGGQSTTSYTINGLSGNTTYYFVVGAGNGCKPGPYSNELSGTPVGSQVTNAPLGFTTTVIGTSASPTVTPAKTVEGFSTLTKGICANCIWWPFLALEIVLIAVFYLVSRKNKMMLRLLGSIAILLLDYVLFLFVNRHCLSGVIDFKFFTIPCLYFWAVSLVVTALEYGVFWRILKIRK